MRFTSFLAALAGVVAVSLFAVAGPAGAAITPTDDGQTLYDALDDRGEGNGTAGFEAAPPSGGVSGTTDGLALFPVAGNDAVILTTGQVNEADEPNTSPGRSSDNGGGGGGHGTVVNDLVELRVDFTVPDGANCLTLDFRFLTEEFPEFIGSQYNDGILMEIDETDFQVGGNGNVEAPNNIAFDPDGFEVTVNSTGTSSDNALGTTFDGGSPVLRATTPITTGEHSLYISIYDANDALYDSAVLVDNMRFRNAKATNCKRGSAPSPKANEKCGGKTPTIIASAGIANGTDGDDVILGTDEDDEIRGKGGDDIICGGGGDDFIRGNQGNDKIIGQAGNDTLKGNVGKDTIRGKRGTDEISGQGGNDDLRGGNGADKVYGGLGDDELRGNRGRDLLAGRQGDDRLAGNKDRDRLRGGPGLDDCVGGRAEDSFKGCE